MSGILEAFATALTPMNLLMVALGTASGVTLGAIPGLTATMAIAILIPFTYGFQILPATALMLGIYCGGMYGGSIAAILIRVPGAPCNAATALDGYPMARQGLAGRAIAMSTIASAVGGLFSTAVLLICVAGLARFVLMFSTEEYFVLTVFGVVMVISLSGRSMTRGFISALLGLVVGQVGLDPILPHPRFTFGVTNLLTGFPVVPVLIGLFCLSQGFHMLEEGATASRPRMVYAKQRLAFRDLWAVRRTLLRSSLIGTLVGIVPAAGPNIAAFLGYSEARRASRQPEAFGTGLLEGIAAPEAANNAVPAGALVPLLSFGIPGDTVTAILLGGLLLHGYTPGPMMIRENVELIYPMFLFLILANLCMLVIGLFGVRPVARLVGLAGNRLLIGAVCMFGVVGGFAYSGQLTEALITVLFGIVGYFLEKIGIPIVPMSITVILGPMMEVYLRQSLIASNGDVWTLVFRPIAAGLWVLAALMIWSSVRVNRRIAQSAAALAASESN